MYRIIGADGKPYGPVSAEDLRLWIREGRASGRTQAQAVGDSGWQPLGSLPEFADVFGGASASPPPLTPSLIAAPPVTPPPNPDGLVAEVLASVGFMLCIIPGLVLIALWTFAWPLLMDKRLDFWPALEVSRQVLWPNVWGILGFCCVGFLLMVVGLLCCYVGVFVAFPLVMAAAACAYEDFFGRRGAALTSSAPTAVTTQTN